MANQEQPETVKQGGAVAPDNIFGDKLPENKAVVNSSQNAVEQANQGSDAAKVTQNFGDRKIAEQANADKVFKEYRESQDVTQDTPAQPGENLKENAVNAPRDAGSAFRQTTREFPRKVERKN